MKIVANYSFNDGLEKIQKEHRDLLEEIEEIIKNVDAEQCRTKKSEEKTKKDQLLYSPVALNDRFRKEFANRHWEKKKIPCEYENLCDEPQKLIDIARDIINELCKEVNSDTDIRRIINTKIQEINSLFFNPSSPREVFEKLKEREYICKVPDQKKQRNKKWTMSPIEPDELIKIITPDFTGYREMDFVKNGLGVEVQFGKYAFMVYNVCAKMTIFANKEIIRNGVEIVPVKRLQKNMSTGVSFFEQFVWDLKNRGVADIDIPVFVIGVDA